MSNLELGSKLEWQRTGDTETSSFAHRTIVDKQFVMPNGKVSHWGTIHPEASANVNAIVLTPDNEVVIARQFRPGPERVESALPGGMVVVFPDETPERALEIRGAETALDEVRQETGYVPDGAVESVGMYYKDGYMNTLFEGFIMYDAVKKEDPEGEDDEFTEPALISIEELYYNATHNLMFDQPTVLNALSRLAVINGRPLF